jgi:hypothetical protein
MITLWQSEDGYVRAVDGVEFPDDAAPEERGDLDTLFRAEAWIVVWRGPDLRWRFTRNRRYAKPGLQALRRIMQRADMPGAQDIWIASTDAHGHILEESTLAPTALAQSLYAAWQKLAVAALPAKIAFLQLNPKARWWMKIQLQVCTLMTPLRGLRCLSYWMSSTRYHGLQRMSSWPWTRRSRI